MLQDEGKSSKKACDEESGVILGCWDQEKTSTLIQDLEHSISLVEGKCKKLYDELKYYKEECVKNSPNFHLIISKRKNRKFRKPQLYCESEPDVTVWNDLNNFRGQGLFEKKFEAKLSDINKELREAALKMGLKDNIIIQPKNYCRRVLKAHAEDEPENFWRDIEGKFAKVNFINDKSKSDPTISEQMEEEEEEEEYSKITKNELELYQKLSRLRMERRRKTSKLRVLKRRKKMRFRLKRKTLVCRKDLPTRKVTAKKTKSMKSNLRKERLRRAREPPALRECSLEKGREAETEKMHKSFREDLDNKRWTKRVRESLIDGNQALGDVIKKAVPFTTCASTSRSYNIGLNMQQLLFLSKQQRKPNTRTLSLQKTDAKTKTQNFESDEATKVKKIANDEGKGCSILSKATAGKSGRTENYELSNLEEIRKDFKPEQSRSSNFREVQYRYTGTSPEGFLEYHKSTKYTNGRRSLIKSESKAAYSVGSKIMVSDYKRTQVFQFDKDEMNCIENASGDGVSNQRIHKLNSEWMKFLKMCKTFTFLKEKLSGDCLTQTDVELKSLENEIDFSIEKYKDFLQIYSKFLYLKSLKTACESKIWEQQEISFSTNIHTKSFHQTYSTSLKKALREVQFLQDKIRVVDN